MNLVKSARLAPGADPQGEPGKFKIASPTEYKKIALKNHNYCIYGCCSCKTVGNSLLKIQFDNHKDILLEDDSKLIYNFFGRELVK